MADADYEIFIGACSGNPGPGGWGARLEGPDGIVELKGGEKSTTNNHGIDGRY